MMVSKRSEVGFYTKSLRQVFKSLFSTFSVNMCAHFFVLCSKPFVSESMIYRDPSVCSID